MGTCQLNISCMKEVNSSQYYIIQPPSPESGCWCGSWWLNIAWMLLPSRACGSIVWLFDTVICVTHLYTSSWRTCRRYGFDLLTARWGHCRWCFLESMVIDAVAWVNPSNRMQQRRMRQEVHMLFSFCGRADDGNNTGNSWLMWSHLWQLRHITFHL